MSDACVPRIVGARLAGPQHVDGTCDDAFGWVRFGAEYQVLAVADGAGSSTGTSAFGAWTACDYLTSPDVARDLVGKLLTSPSSQAGTVLRGALADAHRGVVQAAQLLGLAPKRLSTTLQLAVITPQATFLAAVGDGIFGVDDEGGTRTVLIEEKGDGPANETTFLASVAEDPDCVRIGVLGPVAAIALSTDGLRYSLTKVQQGYSAYIPVLRALWRNVRRGWVNQNVQEYLQAIHDGNDQALDDKSLILATRCLLDSEPREILRIPEDEIERHVSEKPTSAGIEEDSVGATTTEKILRSPSKTLPAVVGTDPAANHASLPIPVDSCQAEGVDRDVADNPTRNSPESA